MLFFHGLGDTADGWASMMPSLNIPDTKFILPTAPTRKITLNRGATMTGWFDMVGLEMTDPEDRDGFEESSARVSSIVNAEISKGIDSKKIIVAGFSQGKEWISILSLGLYNIFFKYMFIVLFLIETNLKVITIYNIFH